MHAAVQFQHPARAGGLVQAVDVLGDDRGQSALALPVRNRAVPGVRPRVRVEQMGPVVVEEVGRMGDEEAVTEDFLGGEPEAGRPVVQPRAGPEVRDTALGGHPGTAEEHDAAAARHDPGEFGVHPSVPAWWASPGICLVAVWIASSVPAGWA